MKHLSVRYAERPLCLLVQEVIIEITVHIVCTVSIWITIRVIDLLTAAE